MASWHAAVMLRVGSLPTPLHSCQGPHDPAPAPYAPHPSSMRPSGMRPSPLRHAPLAPPACAAGPPSGVACRKSPPLSPALACSANKVGRDAPRAQCGPRPHPREYECRDLAVGHVGPLHPYPDCGAGRGGGRHNNKEHTYILYIIIIIHHYYGIISVLLLLLPLI